MRQIQGCGWLLLALTACSGEEFSSSGSHAPSNDNHASQSGAAPRPEPAGGSSSGGTKELPAGGSLNAGNGGPTSEADSGAGSSGGADDSQADNAGGEASNGCVDGAITFHMLPAHDLTPGLLCDAGCGTGWLTITDAYGAMAFPLFSACGTANCESCTVQACTAAACRPTPLTTEGSALVWSGTYLAKDTCGGANMACQRQACVKPGKYKARACAALNDGLSAGGGCTPNNAQVCAEAEFEFPATKTVELMLAR